MPLTLFFNSTNNCLNIILIQWVQYRAGSKPSHRATLGTSLTGVRRRGCEGRDLLPSQRCSTDGQGGAESVRRQGQGLPRLQTPSQEGEGIAVVRILTWVCLQLLDPELFSFSCLFTTYFINLTVCSSDSSDA